MAQLQGTGWFFVSTLVHWECQPPSSTRSREPRPGLWWLTAAAVTLVYYTVLISNFSLFKRTLKTLFLTLVLCEACSCVRGGSGTRLSARLLQALGPGRQGVSSRSGS
ncbi:rCG29470 [Rattus norvegicus]|uniref:RCG29470 n=1 Tax=Rattus norvegicus TaxID=10116 RepID=A6K872_RAT|nr:rCG29470 [Rattus norvegicus]